MQFQVPQFIETEDKIVGPLTLKQFGYIGGAATIVGLLSLVLDFFLWLIIAVVFAAIASTLAFGKMNGRPLVIYLMAFLSSIWSPKVYVFKPKIPTREAIKNITIVAKSKVELAPQETPLSEHKTTAKKAPLFGGIRGLREWLATSKTAIPRREKPLPRNFGLPQKRIQDRFEVVRHLTGEREVAKRIDYR